MAADYIPLPRSSLDSHCDDDPIHPSYQRRRTRRRFPSPVHLLRRFRRACKPIYILLFFLALIVWQILFNASYTRPRPFTIPPDETVFIAANIVNPNLIDGPWGASLVDLVNLIGPDRVHVSIYGGPVSALRTLESKLPCSKTIIAESEHLLNTTAIPHITLSSGAVKITRIAYLAAIRNRALAPLSTLTTPFTKVLFLNDVHFHAESAARLLWGTNVNAATGKSEYKAACGADFISTWKYYDAFATRDTEGYSLGVPIYPWFSREGDRVSRGDVLAGRDNVRVKSCWGGIVAFDGRYFQSPDSTTEEKVEESATSTAATLPLQFRAETELFWDASECCLIHADILSMPSFPPFSSSPQSSSASSSHDTGIYLNPFVRVTYDASTLARMHYIQRIERLFAIPQAIINYFARMPRYNPRRTETAGQKVMDRLWVPNHSTVPTSSKSSSLRLDAAVVAADQDGSHTPQLGSEDSTWQGSGVHGLIGTRPAAKRAVVGSLQGKGKDYWAAKGHYVDYERTAGTGGYCGTRQLLIWREDGYSGGGEGSDAAGGGGGVDDEGKNWDKYVDEVPPLETRRRKS